MARKHRYVSTACLHGLHSRCRDTCKFCGEPCRCTSLECHHESDSHVVDRHNLDYELHQRLALAVHETPGFFTGDASPWAIAESVLKTLCDIPSKEN